MDAQLDHVVVDAQERIDEAVKRYEALGFHLTPRGYHNVGSVNHLAMFGTDYLELLGSGQPGSKSRADLAGFPVGLNGLVFKLTDAQRCHDALQQAGVPVEPVQGLSRPADIDGQKVDVRFNLVRLPPRTVFDGRVYYCEHVTPQYVWRPEWLTHPNGAKAITRLALVGADPKALAAWFPRLVDVAPPQPGPAGQLTVKLGAVSLEVWPKAALDADLGPAAPQAAGRANYMAVMGIKVDSIIRTGEVLRSHGIVYLRAPGGRLRVPATEAMNTTLVFSE
ncbi:MAG TPA: VOC family protein [bacterium]